ncbi:MAG: hypothetical protein A2Y10_20310 [Planctomycetes bacterium GWF2_41_51]|nr:MAG: hypothetical protein A2Y10_20310 [Planctomycetes bacterium GWF2_41_51]HBG25741.1 hypothetical protein [Phycisphaerales bacterium]
MSKLDRVLEYISPQKTIEQVYNLANEAIVSFNFDKAKVDSWEEFKLCIAKFSKYLDEKILKLKKHLDVPLTEYWRFCIQPLTRIYGSNGDITAFTMANTGNEGGLYAVLKAFAMQRAEEYTKNEISAKVHFYWNNLSADEKLQAADEYFSKYKNIIPSELLESDGVLLKKNFWKILEEHPFIMQKLQKTGR